MSEDKDITYEEYIEMENQLFLRGIESRYINQIRELQKICFGLGNKLETAQKKNKSCNHPGCCCVCDHTGRCPECGPTAGITKAITE